MHYGRMRRNGDYDGPTPIVSRYVTAAGYVKILDRNHPLADSRGHVYEHRKVLYEKSGGTPPICFWCGCKHVEWGTVSGDHLNEVKSDNSPENVVAACNDCNRARGSILPFLRGLKPEGLTAFVKAIEVIRGDSASQTSERQTGGKEPRLLTPVGQGERDVQGATPLVPGV